MCSASVGKKICSQPLFEKQYAVSLCWKKICGQPLLDKQYAVSLCWKNNMRSASVGKTMCGQPLLEKQCAVSLCWKIKLCVGRSNLLYCIKHKPALCGLRPLIVGHDSRLK